MCKQAPDDPFALEKLARASTLNGFPTLTDLTLARLAKVAPERASKFELPATLIVETSSNDIDVEIDGSLWSAPPVMIPDVVCGDHKLEFKRKGELLKAQTVTVKEGFFQTYRFDALSNEVEPRMARELPFGATANGAQTKVADILPDFRVKRLEDLPDVRIEEFLSDADGLVRANQRLEMLGKAPRLIKSVVRRVVTRKMKKTA